MNNEQHGFYILSEVLISFLGAVILLAIWSTIQDKYKYKLSKEATIKHLDKGLIYFGLALLVWAVSGLVNYYLLPWIGDSWIGLMIQNVFSILNSMFIIFGLFYLDNAPEYLYNNKKSTTRIIVYLVLLSLISFTLAILFGDTTNTYGLRLSSFPDLVLSAILSWFLMVSFYRTFNNRKMSFIALFAVLSILLLFISQWSMVFYFEGLAYYSDLIRLIAKTSLIFVFLVLGTSWAMELSQIPAVTDMRIHFMDWNQIQLSIPTKGIINQTIEFGKKTTQFNNLLKFAIRRKYAPEQEMCIEIIAGGEISSQTYLSRIVENINEHLALDGDHILSRNDVFTFIGQGKYRLRFLQEHILIDKALLNEFIHNTDNEHYNSFVSAHK